MSELTLEQRRAKDALAHIEVVSQISDKDEKARYRTYAESLPAAILMSGLGQALATEQAAARLGQDKRNAGHRAHGRLVEDLERWLLKEVYKATLTGHAGAAQKKPGMTLLEKLMSSNQQEYLRAQAEALSWLLWLKKLCQAHLPKTQGGIREDDE